MAGAVTGPAMARVPDVSVRPRVRTDALARRFAGGPEGLVDAANLRGQVSVAVAKVSNGQRLEDVDGGNALPPASVAKTVTALYALDRLGPSHRFETRVIAAGSLSDGILTGDLILAGGGDPTLDTDGLNDLAAQMKAAGLKEVRGDFLVYEGALPFTRTIDATQPEHVGYSPAVSGIALNYNRVPFEWRRAGQGYTVSMDARSNTLRPDVEMARMRVERREMPVYTYADRDDRDEWTVASGALGTGGARWLPVRRPGAYAGDVFRTLARSRGIVLKPAKVVRSLSGGQVLARVQSEPMNVLLRDMLKYSTNLTAEMIGMSASAAGGAQPASLRASARQMSDWAAQTYGMSNTRLVDHSGLGDASRMTAFDLVGALVRVRRSDILRPLLKPIPMRDERWREIEHHPVKVNAKTGTLNFVSGLGGFMTAADGTEMAFCILTADLKARAALSKEERERPDGGRVWNGRAKRLQQALIERWGTLYGT